LACPILILRNWFH